MRAAWAAAMSRSMCASDSSASGSSAISSSARSTWASCASTLGDRLAEQAEPLEQPDDVGADAGRRTEIHDVDRHAAADAIEPADALLDRRGLPRQVVEHEPMAELEVAPFAARFGRDEQARPVLGPEPCHLGVATRRRERFVEDAGGELRPRAQRLAQHLERLAMGDEDQRLLIRPTPARGLRHQPVEARIGAIHGVRVLTQLGLVRTEHGLQRRTGRQRPPDAIDGATRGHGIGAGAARGHQGFLERAAGAQRVDAAFRRELDRDRHARRQPADVHATRRAGARRQRHAGRQPRLDVQRLGKFVRPQQLQQAEEPVRVVLERRRAEQQHVTAERGDRRDGAIFPLARMSAPAPQPLRLVDDEQVDAGGRRLAGQLGPLDQRLERDDRAAMDVERVEAGPEVAHDIGQARRIEQREHLVILAPQLAQPLHRERLGHDHQAAVDRPRVQQPVHDQRRFDGLAQPDFVGEQPSHRHPGGGALRDVQLVREQPHAAAEERSETVGLARRQQVQDVQARQEVLGLVDLAVGQPLEQRPVAPRQSRRLGQQRVAARGEPERRATLGKVDDQAPAFDCRDASGAELGVEAVGQVVPDGPGMHAPDS